MTSTATRTDSERLDWLISVIGLDAADADDAKLAKVMGAVLMGKLGRAALDAAMDAE